MLRCRLRLLGLDVHSYEQKAVNLSGGVIKAERNLRLQCPMIARFPTHEQFGDWVGMLLIYSRLLPPHAALKSMETITRRPYTRALFSFF